eukprot:TRINITY_DN17375_c0_g1_i1.p1 TRINITY_DN17375_c0_g1~~TRINITY_DN17375_c0_g1_i1.p1  ORF type:complete len:224 (+),score=40.59 TRINITY_DN17375_c0_g1_i1:62-673(+)
MCIRDSTPNAMYSAKSVNKKTESTNILDYENKTERSDNGDNRTPSEDKSTSDTKTRSAGVADSSLKHKLKLDLSILKKNSSHTSSTNTNSVGHSNPNGHTYGNGFNPSDFHTIEEEEGRDDDNRQMNLNSNNNKSSSNGNGRAHPSFHNSMKSGNLHLNLAALDRKEQPVGFHEEFMARIDEFSLSWRQAAMNERKIQCQFRY